MLPDDVVGLFEGGGVGGGDQLVEGGHEVGDLLRAVHPGDPVVAAGDDAQQLPVGGAVVGDGDGVVAGDRLQVEDVLQGGVGPDVGIGGDIPRLIRLDPGDHSRLVLDRLGAVDKGDAALSGQGDCHLLAGDRLHDCRNQRDVHHQRAFLFPLAVLDDRGAEADVGRDTIGRGKARDQQVFAKGMGRFFIDKCHLLLSYSVRRDPLAAQAHSRAPPQGDY